ncbi:SDR family oxidoreductase [Sphaerisporangium sp. TRM90804]|uniref:SDR family oxidoreductase n=1 Tax=Sphaerisporangium sp. TRM90804 TaxID=3031113 RepID=UPI002447F2DF|nr:SDR family oxidoreductase [Sphaerisporangium sp. TRM90804]MDH2426757.1 SDR family oxidoreductase [Sphaerisporangium sp. TRM90804]
MRTIDAGDVRLALYEQGDPDAATVLLVHGYPDTHRVWDDVAGLLATDFHVVRYDVRGAGRSCAPRERDAYSLDRLVDDLAAVLSTLGDRKVHLVGHDWGSIQGWEAAHRLSGRIASFTSLGGPGLDQWAAFIRTAPRAHVAGQLLRSWYIAAFQAPGVPEFAWRAVAPRLLGRARRRSGRDDQHADGPGATLVQDGTNGLNLYRANLFAGRAPRPEPYVEVPVQIIESRKDVFVSPRLTASLERWAPRVWHRAIPAGHWAQRSHPRTVARMIAEFARHVEHGTPPSRELGRALVTPGRKAYDRRLVVVTGAGSGIGRATARAFASHGAEVICADLDPEAARRTAGEIGRRYGPAHAAEVDVASADQMERFARDVLDRHGTPDIVVNNAGSIVAGPFLDHELEDLRKMVDVNIWGVVHGCRLFGRQMVERGEGGHIVNVASVGAFVPSRILPAYSMAKAAVKMLGDCLRAELAGQGIGVTSICPGIVSTAVARNAVYRSEDRSLAEKAVEWRRYPPERVAAHILRAVHRDDAVVPVNAEGKIGYLLSRLSPGLLRGTARLSDPALFLRGRGGRQIRTGAKRDDRPGRD